jgi:hypothetical protein
MIVYDPRNPKGIVWLASYPKSGNTWLRMFLYQLARIRRGQPREKDEINKLARVSIHDVAFEALYKEFLGKAAEKATPADFSRVRPLVQEAIARQSPSIVFLKTHSVRGVLDNVPTINPAASAGGVYLVRDPRDVAVSLWHHTGRSLDFAVSLLNQRNAFAFGTIEVWGSWSQNVDSWTEGADDSLLVLRYEDMLADNIRAFSSVLKHVRQTASPQVLVEAIRCSSFDEMKDQEEAHGFQEKHPASQRFFVEGRAGSWREILTTAHVDSIVEAHGATMKRFGYLD